MVKDLSGNGIVDDIAGRGSVKQFVARSAIAITPDDAVDLAQPVRGLYNGDAAAGSIAFVSVRGDTLTFNNVQPGDEIPIAAKRVLATGTSLTNIKGLI